MHFQHTRHHCVWKMKSKKTFRTNSRISGISIFKIKVEKFGQCSERGFSSVICNIHPKKDHPIGKKINERR